MEELGNAVLARLKARQFPEALEMLSANPAELESDYRLLYYQAIAYYKTNQPENACESARKSVDVNPKFSKPLLIWSLSLIKLGAVHEAYRRLKELVIREPANEVAAKLLRDITSKFLIVDDGSHLFDEHGLEYREFVSDYNQIRFYSLILTQTAPDSLLQDQLFTQQLSEIVKNAIRHGNRGNIDKKVRVWYKIDEHQIRYIIADEGEGFNELDNWNAFNQERLKAIENNDFEKMMHYITYTTARSKSTDGGNSLFASLNYWDEGLIYNEKKNKVAVVKRL